MPSAHPPALVSRRYSFQRRPATRHAHTQRTHQAAEHKCAPQRAEHGARNARRLRQHRRPGRAGQHCAHERRNQGDGRPVIYVDRFCGRQFRPSARPARQMCTPDQPNPLLHGYVEMQEIVHVRCRLRPFSCRYRVLRRIRAISTVHSAVGTGDGGLIASWMPVGDLTHRSARNNYVARMNFPHCSDEAFRPLRGYAPRKSRP